MIPTTTPSRAAPRAAAPVPAPRLTAARREALLRLACLAPPVLLLGLLVGYPIVETLWLSLTHSSLIHPDPVFVGLENFATAAASPTFRTVLLNTLVWTVLVVALQFLLGMAAASLLSKRFHGRALLRVLLVVPWVMPGITAGLLWKMLEDPYLGPINAVLEGLGLVNGDPAWLAEESTALLGVVVAAAWKGFPVSALMYLAAYQSVPDELREAARTDGAGPWRVFWHVTLPSMAPTIRTTVLLTTVWTFNTFDLIYVMTKGGPGVSSEVMSSLIYRTAFVEVDHGAAASYGVVSVAVLAVFSVLYLRQVRGAGGLR